MTLTSEDEEEERVKIVMMMPAAYLQSILRVHQEVSSDIIEHYSVLPVVKLSILSPYHTQGLHLETCMMLNTQITFSKTQQ